ncbi:MAG: mechanosensitive ion channel family protein [Huintestinicola sp.]
MEEAITEAVTEAAVSDIASEAENVMQAVASGTVDRSVLKSFADTLLAYLPTVVAAIVIYIVGKIAAKIIMRVIDKAMGRSRVDPTAQSFLKSMFNIVLTAFVLVIALSTLGIPMTSIITAIGAAGVAIGLALQNSLSNVAGGFIILFTKPFGKGDYVSTNGVEGVVDEISILSTKLITIDNKVIYIPNGAVSGSTVTNFSREEKRRVDLVFSTSYDQDFREVIKIIKDILEKHPLVLSDEEAFARVSSLSDSSVDITVRAWVKTADYWTVYFDLIEQVKTAFDENGIEIPYSKLDVNVSQK